MPPLQFPSRIEHVKAQGMELMQRASCEPTGQNQLGNIFVGADCNRPKPKKLVPIAPNLIDSA